MPAIGRFARLWAVDEDRHPLSLPRLEICVGWRMPRTAARAAAIPAEDSPAAYPVQKLPGCCSPIWTAAGSLAAALGRLGAGRRQTLGHDRIRDRLQLLQPMEKLVDPSHLYWLHGFSFRSGHLAQRQYEEKHEFIPFEYGIMKRRITPGKNPSTRRYRRTSADLSDQPAPCLQRGARQPRTGLSHNIQIACRRRHAHAGLSGQFHPSNIDKSPATRILPMSTVR